MKNIFKVFAVAYCIIILTEHLKLAKIGINRSELYEDWRSEIRHK